MNDLKFGMEGYPVTLLQYALRRAGMDVGNLDGIFGRRTARALQRFQREQGLAADDIAGKLTWAALYPYISGYTLHRIGSGDTFYGLAQRYGIPISSLITANPDDNPAALSIGETLIVPLPLPVVTEEIPCSSLLAGLILKGMVMRYPFLRLYEIGRSVMGRPMWAVSAGKGPRQAGVVGPHRADEWSAAIGLLRFVETIAAALETGERWAKELRETLTLHLIPLVNPDGVDLVTGALDPMDSFYVQAQAMAAHYGSDPFPDGWQSNISGIDLSLQYPAGWKTTQRAMFAQGITRPGPKGYVGSEPLIAPEVRAIAKWTRRRDFSTVLSYDEGYARWFADVWDRRAVIVKGSEEGILSHLGFGAALSP